MPSTRNARWMLIAAIFGVLALQVLCLGRARFVLWGPHVPVFLPLPIDMVGWSIVALASLIALGRERAPRLPSFRAPRGGVAWGVGLVAAALVLWLARSGQDLLGDAVPLTRDLPNGLAHHPRQPLTQAIQQALYQLLSPLFAGDLELPRKVAARTVAIGSVCCGVLYIPVAAWLARELVELPGTVRRGALALLLTQGWSMLFFGYLENYTFVTLALLVHVAATMRWLRTGQGLGLSAFTLILSITLHVAAVLAAPGWILVVVLRSGRGLPRRDFLELIVALALGFALVSWLQARAPGYSLLQAIQSVLGLAQENQGGGTGWGYVFSWIHLNDWFNAQWLLGPVGIGAAIASGGILLVRRRRPGMRSLYLLAVASTIGAAHFLMAEPTLGYARDWDLFAPSGALVSVTAIAGLLAVLPPTITARGFFALIVLSLWTTGAWVAVNASETRSAERFAHVPLGLGRTEVVLGNWHWRNDRPLEARRWLEFALRRNPLNNNAHALLAAMSAEAGDFRDARERMAEAVRLRPRKIEYHAALLEFCDRDGAARPAIAELERWLVLHDSDPDVWLDLAQRRSAVGGLEAAQPALLRAVELYESRWNEGTRNATLAIRIGDLRAGRAESELAAQWYRKALELDPAADAARRRLIAIETESPTP